MNEANVTRRELTARQKVAVIVVDVLLIVELCVAMYLASAAPEAFTPVFMKSFFSMLAPTLVAGYVGVRLLREKTTRVESASS
jgi:hypothetical protein